MTKPLRQAMPTIAALIDDLRAAFGAECIHDIIRAGLDGQPVFHARENGYQIGTPVADLSSRSIKLSETIVGPLNLAKRKPV